MKKAIIFILYVFVVTIIFSGCNLLPINTDQFDMGDTVTIKVNEKLYESKDIWVRLDSITRDDRCPVGYRCELPGGVEAKFTVGFADTSITMYLSTDSVLAKIAFFAFTQVPGGRNLILNLITAQPLRHAGIDIPQRNYEIDFVLEEGDMVYKPNIYLYPTHTTKMNVSLILPQGGCICESDPQYPAQWQNIKVKPSGSINNEYEYLFYEAVLPDTWQYESGWSVKMNDLETFFRENMAEYGFVDHEINDFIDYWIPKLQDSPYYNIYPQHTEKVNGLVELNISKIPNSVLRLFYVIKTAPEKEDMPVPEIPAFDAKGFTVREWGVVLK
jgi:hypothetical protein